MTEAPKTPKTSKGVEVECIRKFFVEDLTSDTGTRMILPGDIETIPSAMAKKLQKNGVIMVNIDD